MERRHLNEYKSGRAKLKWMDRMGEMDKTMAIGLMVDNKLGPIWIMYILALGIIASFILGLNNSVVYYETLPKTKDADILVFYQPSCPHCIAELPTIKRLVADGYRVSAFNVFKHPELAKRYNVTETPTLVVDGHVLVGEQSYETIKDALNTNWVPGSGEKGKGCSIGGDTCSLT